MQVDSSGKIHAISDLNYSIVDPNATAMSLACLLNAASFFPGVISPVGLTAVAPGEIVSLFGNALGPVQPTGAHLDANGNVGRAVAGVRVLFDGVPAPLLYVQAKQINAIVPYEVSGKTSTDITVEYQGAQTQALAIPVDEAVPGVFTLDGSGFGPAAVLNQNGTINSPSNPAKKGSIIAIYATGAGQSDPPGVDGKLAVGELPKPQLPVSVRFTEPIDAEILYAGAAPGFVAGALQINVRIPTATHSGTVVPFTVTVGHSSSSDIATIAVQ
jgi:uncharacterized protein (TIGR03437 family)